MRGRSYLPPKLRVDAIGGDDKIALGEGTVRERYPSHVTALLTAGAAMVSVHHVSR
jgi:hypothetical protein